MSQTFFITSSGTNVGKTLVTAALSYQLRMARRRVSVLKPVISGYVEGDLTSDTALLLQSMGLPVNPVTVEAVSPWRLAAPLALNVAAAQEGKEITFTEVVDFCNLSRTSEFTLIEGAGGVMAPITHTRTMLDLVAALQCPAIVVAGTYLGAISHALTAGEVLRVRGVPVQAVVVSESENGAMGTQETATELKQFFHDARYIVPLPRIAGGDRLWEHAADLTWMLT